MSYGRHSSLLALALGAALMGAQELPDARVPADDGFFLGSRRARKPTSTKHRGDARAANRTKNKAAKKARKGNRK